MLLTAPDSRAALDAPHDTLTGTGCLSCHQMTSTYAKLLPPLNHTPLPGDIDDTTSNGLCWSCHNGTNPLYVKTHSSLTTSTKYGNWTVECWVCHSQHSQEQDNINGTTYGMFIRSSVNLAHIKAADGNTLGKTGSRAVKFIANTGANSFADGDTTINGICEVCHTDTTAWHNDGTLAGETAHTGLKGSDCTRCHPHTEGFKADYQCLDCHADPANNETKNNARADIKAQFASNSHHVQRADGSIQNSDCYQCHWEADVNGKITSHHSATSSAPVDLVVRDINNDGLPGARPGTYTLNTTAIQYTAGTSPALNLNPHCLGCHNDDLNNFTTDDDTIPGGGIFSDGKAPNVYAWDESVPDAKDGTSIEARYSQTDPTDTTTWGKYNGTRTAAKQITKAYSAHGNAQNNYGGGWSAEPSCFGPNVSQATCPDLGAGGSWDFTTQQCDNLTSAQCAQNYCTGLTSTSCAQVIGTWGPGSGICKNVPAVTCETGYCVMGAYLYADSTACSGAGGFYRYSGSLSQYICTNVSACVGSGNSWATLSGSLKTGGSYIEGTDYSLNPTRGGAAAVKVACFDCHNSHGSTAGDADAPATSYASATITGGILKNTVNGKGGYTANYTPAAGGSDTSKNVYNPGAALCFDCHMNATAGPTPWGYQGTFNAKLPIMGYWDTLYFGNGTFASQQRYAYKTGMANQGGHFGASNTLKGLNGVHDGNEALHQINGLCTPCHDPHGISPTLGSNRQYAVPLLKGTWVTSPYREDVAPAVNVTKSVSEANAGNVYHIDQNTFSTHIMTTVTADSVDSSKFAGLCLRCHPQGNLTDGANDNTAWMSVDRLHEAVKGWGANSKHVYTCSKCHTPHNSRLPRLMVTNCLDTNHKGRAQNNPLPVLNGSGDCYSNGWCWDNYGTLTGSGVGGGGFPGDGAGSGSGGSPCGNVSNSNAYSYAVSCHENRNANQVWNGVTQW